MERNKLAGYLKEYNIKQAEVADVIGKSVYTANKKINNKMDFTRSEIKVLHEKLHIPINIFF